MGIVAAEDNYFHPNDLFSFKCCYLKKQFYVNDIWVFFFKGTALIHCSVLFGSVSFLFFCLLLYIYFWQSLEQCITIAPSRCSGGHGFDSCRGNQNFLCRTLMSCWSIHHLHFINELKIHHLYSVFITRRLSHMKLVNWLFLVDRAPARCLKGHGFDSCRGLRIFFFPRLCLVDPFTFHMNLILQFNPAVHYQGSFRSIFSRGSKSLELHYRSCRSEI